MNTSINRKKINLILDWCVKNFGYSVEYKFKPKIRVYNTCGYSIDNDGLGRYGHYREGTVTIFLPMIKSIRMLCNTVIHEYKHYLMSDKDYMKIEKKLIKQGVDPKKMHNYHPHEKKANNFEKKWGGVCFKELKYHLYKKE